MNYVSLLQSVFKDSDYLLKPLNKTQMFEIMKWRNDQIENLRQSKVLTKKDQINYYQNIILPSLKENYPQNILLGISYKKKFIGYGGLVHIDWENRNAEVSFLVNTKILKKYNSYVRHQKHFMAVLKKISFEDLNLKKIYAVTFGFRNKKDVKALEDSGFKYEASLKNFLKYNGSFHDIIYHSIENSIMESKKIKQ